MGSPMEPTLSNLFMGVLENKYLCTNHSKNVKFYKRYVDDILIIFEDESEISSFLIMLIVGIRTSNSLKN